MECAPTEENARRTGDARLMPGWQLSAPAEDDELGVEICARHTVVTTQPERLLSLWLDVLGGQIVHEGQNELINASSTYVSLGDGVFECAVRRPGRPMISGFTNPEPYDTYHSMTFKVRDLERAERHLTSQGIRIALRDDTSIVTDPSTSFGVPWGFTTLLTPGDQRCIPSR
jgi:hypothetical protein